MRVGWILFLLLSSFRFASAQQSSPWQGEWGAFTDGTAQLGQRLSIHDCQGAMCRFLIESRSHAGHSETASDQTLTIQSSTEAVAILPGETSNAICTLHFVRQTDPKPKPSITVQATGDTCTSYYSTSPTVSMSGTYPLQSTTNYIGLNADKCFQDPSAAIIATCTHTDIAALEQQWQELAETYPLQPPTSKDPSAYEHLLQMDAAILHHCDADADAAQCLTARYTADIAAMQAKKNAYLDRTVERGDPADAHRLAAKSTGRYRHSFRNGDVQGDQYTTTDTLTIRPVGAASIHFDAELNFFNGHTCSLSGGALYRKDGSFVFDDSPAHSDLPDTPACRLAIIPTPTGVKFNDINGACKDYCGERGSWGGKGFTFKERVPDAATTVKSKRPTS
ncbi:MAG: hypothetical protein ABI177_05530 [Edaphobacter sp.]